MAGNTPVLVALCVLAASLAACGGGGGRLGAATASPSGVKVSAPGFTLQGCTYEVNNSIPVGEPTGINPHFSPYSPDPTAGAALRTIKEKGGTAMVDGVGVPGGTTLYSGPDTSSQAVGVVPVGDSVLISEPVIWTLKGGGTWFAFFIECGGPSLYWGSLDQIAKQDPGAATSLRTLLSQLKSAPPYTTSDEASMLPVTITGNHLAWVNPTVRFPVGRGQLIKDP